MPCECCALGLDEIFGDRVARHEARRFRRKGLPARSRKLLEGLARALPLEGASTLEVGAGVGGLTITLLRRGVGKALIIDAVPLYVAAARSLAEEFDVGESLEIRLGNYAEIAPELEPVDAVVMDRVVCCYPRWQELLAPAARQAGVIGLTYPRDVWWSRAGLGVINMIQKLRRMAFRVYLHSPAEMHRLLTEQGFETQVVGHHGAWEIAVATRAP